MFKIPFLDQPHPVRPSSKSTLYQIFLTDKCEHKPIKTHKSGIFSYYSVWSPFIYKK